MGWGLLKTKMSEYLDKLRAKKIAAIGIGISNTPLIKLLLRYGCAVTACDKRSRAQFGGLAGELETLGAELRLGDDYLDGLDHDLIFRTPGMRPDVSELLKATSRGAELTSEMEAFFEVCPCNLIAVTGSDGKTTTTTIISELLKASGRQVYLGGNIGTPLFSEAEGMKEKDWAVLELSSFQLMTMRRSPKIAVVTNITPNHLDYHKSMSEYTQAKENIFRHQGREDLLILNADNEITNGFRSAARGRVRMFSISGALDNGYYFDGRSIVHAEGGRTVEIVKADEIKLPGLHNIENFMAAFAAVGDIVGYDICREVAMNFAGVEHRIELVRKLHGVSYYNDSIASSPSRTIAGLRSFNKKVILIAGGYDKNISYDELGSEIVRQVKTLVLTGNTAMKIKAATEKAPEYIEGKPDIILIEDFGAAVRAAVQAAKEGDVVILSPASASFDKFKNFAERGEAFKKIIYELE
jgi:UDP-N-acetylmuramoylalanine--D-glutamate ligase